MGLFEFAVTYHEIYNNSNQCSVFYNDYTVYVQIFRAIVSVFYFMESTGSKDSGKLFDVITDCGLFI